MLEMKWGEWEINRNIEVLFCFGHKEQERQDFHSFLQIDVGNAIGAKRILFLADRISLVEQAKRRLCKVFWPQHASVNLLEEKDNPDARIAFST